MGAEMANLDLKALVGRLDQTCSAAIDAAAGMCLKRTHYELDFEHLFSKLLDSGNSDLMHIIAHFGINKSHLERDLSKALDGLKSGSSRGPTFSPNLLKLIEEAWLHASINMGAVKIRSGYLVLAALTDVGRLAHALKACSREFERISRDELARRFADIVADSDEDRQVGARATAVGSEVADGSFAVHGTDGTGGSALSQFTVNLTARAKSGSIDPVLGRESEIRQMIDILTRRRQNNPILTGEAGVGKTAVVEGLALRIAAGDVPPPLQQVQLHGLDLALLQAGASVKGEFERRLKAVIEEVKASAYPIILFIDEAHTLIGAGGPAGQGDAANLLKPALARGEVRTIAATTWSEYKEHFEKDAALARRFQVIKVDEPTEQKASEMLRGLVEMMEKHHKVRILDEAVSEAAKLSARYLPGRQLPDKAVSVLDTACARVRIGQTATPAPIEDARRRIEAIDTERRVLAREAALGQDHADRTQKLGVQRAEVEAELAQLQERWEEEKTLVNRILEIRDAIEAQSTSSTPASVDPRRDEVMRAELAKLITQLEQIQQTSPQVHFCVTAQIVAEVISGWTGVPLGKMLHDELDTVRKLHALLGERVLGQQYGLDEIAKRIRIARANLEDPSKPKGVFLLVGTSGVGKTETALALADILYGGERNVITINMSEFKEAHSVSTLKGSPPGYVGYGKGGVLTEAVRRRPHSVVLLDEIEKAHPDVRELFFQVFDKGQMEDAEGREVDFKNTVIILTSNVGTDEIMAACRARETLPSATELVEMLRPLLNKVFKPAFVGRMTVVPYYPILPEVLTRIIRLKLNKVVRRIQENHAATLQFDEAVVKAIADRCNESDSGARLIDNILTSNVLPEISDSVLARMAEGQPLGRIDVKVAHDGRFQYAFS